jgi:hypothetical protein
MTLSPRLKRQKREKLLAKYGRGCWLCGKEIREDQMVTLDHVRPRAKGGSHRPTPDAQRPTAMTIRMSKHTAFAWARHFVTGLSSLRDRAAARLAALRFNPSRSSLTCALFHRRKGFVTKQGYGDWWHVHCSKCEMTWPEPRFGS